MIAGSQQFHASLDQLYDMLQYIRAHAEKAGFENNTLLKIELASEEAIVNIINHGYPSKSGFISINCSLIPNGFEIAIQDDGVPFDPTKHIADPSDRIGGYGVLLMIKIMDEVRYTRNEGKNNLVLIKNIN